MLSTSGPPLKLGLATPLSGAVGTRPCRADSDPSEGRATLLGANATADFGRRNNRKVDSAAKIVNHEHLELLHHLVANTLEANDGQHSIVFADARTRCRFKQRSRVSYA